METNLAQLIRHIIDKKSPQLFQNAEKQLESMRINDPINLILSFLDFLSVDIYTNLDKTQALSLKFAAAMVGRVLMVNSPKEHQAYWAAIPEHVKDKIKKKLSISMLKNHSREVNKLLGMLIGQIASLPEQQKKDSWLKQTMKQFFWVNNQASLYNVLIILNKYFERSIKLNGLEESEIVNTLVCGFKRENIQIKILTLQALQNYILKYDIITNQNTPLKKIVQPLYQNICQISKDPNDDHTAQNLKILDEILKYRISFFFPTLDQLYHCLETIFKNKAKNSQILYAVITIMGYILDECFKKSTMKYMQYVYRSIQLLIAYLQQIDLHLYNSKTQQAQTRYLSDIQQQIEDRVKLIKQQIQWIYVNLKQKTNQRKALLNYLDGRVRQLIDQSQTNCFVASILVAFLNSRFEQIKYYFQKFAKMFSGQSISLKYIACWGFQSFCYQRNNFIDKNQYSIYAMYAPLIFSLLDKSSRISIKSCHTLCTLLKHCSQNQLNQENFFINYNEVNSKILDLIRGGQPFLQIHYLECLNECFSFFAKETIGNIESVYKFLILLIQQHRHSQDHYTCMMICRATCNLFTLMKLVQQKFSEADWANAFGLMMEVIEPVIQVRKCADWVIQAGVEVVLKLNKGILLHNCSILNTYLHLLHQTLALHHNHLHLSPSPQNPQIKPNNKELPLQQQRYIRFLQNYKNKIIKDTTIEEMQLWTQKQKQNFQILTTYFKQYLIKILYVNNPGIFLSVAPFITDYCQHMRKLKGQAALTDASEFVGGLLDVLDPDGDYQIVNIAVFTLKYLTQQLNTQYLSKNQCQLIFTKLSTLYWNYSMKTKFENQSQNKCLNAVVCQQGTGAEKIECQTNIMHILISVIKGHYTLCLPYIEIAMHNLVPFQLSLDTSDFQLRTHCGLIFITQFLGVLHQLSFENKVEGAEGLIKNILKSFRSILENKDYRSQISASMQKMRKSFQLLNQIRLQQIGYGTLLCQENWAEVGALLKCKQVKKI